MDDYHSIVIWDWKKGKQIASTRGHGDKIFDCKFNPYNNNQLVSCGVKHIKFWTLCGNSLSGKKGVFGRKGNYYPPCHPSIVIILVITITCTLVYLTSSSCSDNNCIITGRLCVVR
jgi:WD40 repeat protein